MKRRVIAEKEERRRKSKAAVEENAALERMKAIMKSGGRKGAQCCTPSLPNAHGGYLSSTTSRSIRFIDLRMIHHCKPITLIKFLMILVFLNRGAFHIRSLCSTGFDW